jgi:hypothetical protein
MRLFTCAAAVASIVVFSACGDSSGSAGVTVTPDAGSNVDAGPTVKQTGSIVDFDEGTPLAGATVTDGTHTATTASDGTYTLDVLQGVPFTMTVAAPQYVTLVEQSSTLAADADRGSTLLLALADEPLLEDTLNGYDATLGVLSVAVLTTGSCTTQANTTLTVSPAGNSQIVYMAHHIPNSTYTSVQDMAFPSAAIYNLPTGVPITVTIQGGTCTPSTYPVTYQGITYGPSVSTQPGNVTAFARVFLQ